MSLQRVALISPRANWISSQIGHLTVTLENHQPKIFLVFGLFFLMTPSRSPCFILQKNRTKTAKLIMENELVFMLKSGAENG